MQSKKYRYLTVIQQNYGSFGWEGCSEYEHGNEVIEDLKNHGKVGK